MIYLHWKKYQQKLVQSLKKVKEGVVIAGDGRHDSMGHSAKYGAYHHILLHIVCVSLALGWVYCTLYAAVTMLLLSFALV